MSDDIRENQFLADIRSAAQGEATAYNLEPIIRKEFYYKDIITALQNGGGGSGGFTPTTEQLAAMNSGITTEGVQQISTNETNISKIDELVEYNHTYRTSDYSLAGYISSTTGAFIANNSFASTDYIDVVHTNSKIIGKAKGNSNYAAYAFYDSSKQLISLYAPNSDSYVEFSTLIPNNAKYVRLSTRATDTETFAKIEWKISTAIETLTTNVEAIEETVQPTYNYYVDANVEEDNFHYKSLVDCLWAVADNPDIYKIIHIAAGTYDVLEELGGMEHIMQYASPVYDAYSEGVQPWITNCKIIGYGKVILNFKIADNTPRDNYWLFSCLNVKGNIEIENIEIHSKNCRYSIHDESGTDYPNTNHIYRNVRLYQDVNEGTAGGQAFGSGFSANSKVELHNCYIEVGLNTIVAFTCHAYNGVNLLFNNSIFIGGVSTFNIRISQVQSVGIYARFNGAYIGNGLKISEETDRNVDGKTKIDLINTTLPNINNSYNTNSEAVVSYDTINHTRTVLVPTT